MTRIAQISDVHVLERRSGCYGLGVHFLSFGRRLDARDRIRKLHNAIGAARQSGADHFVFSGDLTESGTPAQYEALAEALTDSGLEPEKVTLVPGNHDAYEGPLAWNRAMQGPLKAFAPSGATQPGKVVEHGDLCILPLDATFHQPITRSAGVLTDDVADVIDSRLADSAFREKVMLIVQHHPPYAHPTKAWQWIDGLVGAERMTNLLERHPRAYVMHGHLHRSCDRALGGTGTRVFGAPAVVEDRVDSPRVRMFEVRGGAIESAGLALG